MKPFSASFFLSGFLIASTVLFADAMDPDVDLALPQAPKVVGTTMVEEIPIVSPSPTKPSYEGPRSTKSPTPTKAPTKAPTGVPSSSPAPTKAPTRAPSGVPSSSPAPTIDCTCCDCIHTCTIQPDPHYRTWDNSFYDFQGGCDQYAIKNDIIEVQIATRPRTYYSTITQITVLMKQTAESFKIALNTQAVNTIVTGAAYSVTGSTHRIDFDNVPSFIKISEYSHGLVLQVQGHGTIFSNSEGMCGSWNQGGVRRSNGSVYSTAGGWQGTALTSFSLADSWKIPPTLNQLVDPALDNNTNLPICDASKVCGAQPANAFPCNAVRKLVEEGPVIEDCDKTCSDIKDKVFADACRVDLTNTGDDSWACQSSYLEPVLEKSSPCEFDKSDDEKCKPKKKKNGYVCHRLGGTCVRNCEKNAPPGHTCLKDLCNIRKKTRAPKAKATLEIAGKKKKKTCDCLVPFPCSREGK